ncbi:hypothetical protein [Jeotgalibacillus haloalkalitolerans]|uniref:Uncharacterized protein n=1 Tax=Jeotgalibacillus haloalkalitolerans TaxID=3104292 RepID=A0ABU5KKY1_9BACL|nr:hypothetical protein [Jeotgalibacillus sp. HH7-29]MDZ5711835.1 hypothetical protein [Jeotgalibacillus sp. HH7-29]
MNRKQWVLLITMSTVLMTSAITLILLIISEPSLDDYDVRPAQLEEDEPESDPPQNGATEESAEERENKVPPANDSHVVEPAEDETDTVNDHYGKTSEPDDQKEIESDKNQKTEQKTDINLEDPQLPEEPEINFEDVN